MIIDCHGHYTTAPPALQGFRDVQLDRLVDPTLRRPSPPTFSDDEIRTSIENNQLRVARERGIDLTIFSPKAAGMEHHVDDMPTAAEWARTCNDLVHRVTELFPDQFMGACQLPQTPSGDLILAISELFRCVEELGFVACNLNPDPSGGYFGAPPLTDEYWFPLYEAMVELRVPAMIHVSDSCSPCLHTTGSHYLNADTAAFVQLAQGDLFVRFPTLQFIIPHGGGAVPYHWGRFRGIAERGEYATPSERVMSNVAFDTCVYHRPGLELLFNVVAPHNIVFGSEMLGAVAGVDPDTGHEWDDTKAYIESLELSSAILDLVFEKNARRLYPRLDERLGATARQDLLT